MGAPRPPDGTWWAREVLAFPVLLPRLEATPTKEPLMKSKRSDGPSLYLVLGHELAAVSGGHIDPATGKDDGCGEKGPAAKTETKTETKTRTEVRTQPVEQAKVVPAEPRPVVRCGTVVPAGYLYRVY
jgi:hypothetical protein